MMGGMIKNKNMIKKTIDAVNSINAFIEYVSVQAHYT
jgi:hypothetical protein